MFFCNITFCFIDYICFMQKLALLIRYIYYLYRSSTSYGVHPPFLFDLVTRVFENNSIDAGCLKVEELKDQLVRDKRTITVTDLGAGSVSGKGKERRIGIVARISSKPKKYGRLLYRLVNYLQPENILELGTSLGLSSSFMSLGAPSSKIITIEGCPNISALAEKNFHALNLQNIKLINGNFDNELPEVLKDLTQIDLLFVDGNHQREPTIKYFEQCLTKAVNETVFVFDDIHWSEGMEEAWNYIRNHPSVTLSVDIFFMGIVFFKKELTKQHFIIRF
jgi:predicted O-methyltransferase YrrM